MTDKIKARRLRLAGHCVRHGEKENAESASVELAGSLAQKTLDALHPLFVRQPRPACARELGPNYSGGQQRTAVS